VQGLLLDLVRYAVAAELDLAALLCVVAVLAGEEKPPELSQVEPDPVVPIHYYPH
jgi:hypothetical protein